MVHFLKCLFSSSLKWRRQVLSKWTQRTSSTWLPLPLSTLSIILMRMSHWSLPEIWPKVFRLLISSLASRFILKLAFSCLSPCNLRSVVLHLVLLTLTKLVYELLTLIWPCHEIWKLVFDCGSLQSTYCMYLIYTSVLHFDVNKQWGRWILALVIISQLWHNCLKFLPAYCSHRVPIWGSGFTWWPS